MPAAETIENAIEPEQPTETIDTQTADIGEDEPSPDSTASDTSQPIDGVPSPNDTSPAVLSLRVEAILITADKAVSAAKIADTLALGLDEGGSKAIMLAVDELNRVYEESGRTFRIERIAGGYRMMTRPEFAETVERQRQSRTSSKLSQAALETLAIVAYRQPMTRADIESIRGVACGEVLRSLLERHLIKITGRADEVGRPMLYGTTKHFLEVFGLSSTRDLPESGELREP